jgi:hypothetical protein
MKLKNISNSFNEIIINKTLNTQHLHPIKSTNNEFSSLLTDKIEEQEVEMNTDEIDEKEESSLYKISQQVELQNTSYLNKIFLFSVA